MLASTSPFATCVVCASREFFLHRQRCFSTSMPLLKVGVDVLVIHIADGGGCTKPNNTKGMFVLGL